MITRRQEKYGEDTRRHSRRKVLWSGSLECGEYTFDCRVFDISLRGAQIRLDLPLAPGAEVNLAIKRLGSVPCRVTWQRDGRIGLLFLCGGDYIEEIFGDKTRQLGLVNLVTPEGSDELMH